MVFGIQKKNENNNKIIIINEKKTSPITDHITPNTALCRFSGCIYAVPKFSLHRASIPMGLYLCIKYKINKKNNKRIIKKTAERIIES